MDKHSEVEVKFDATNVSIRQYYEFLIASAVDSEICTIHNFKVVEGVDTYFVLNSEPLRLREGGDKEVELTYKQRKSKSSINDRVEINLPMKAGVKGRDVMTFISYLGAKLDFIIGKTSYIYHVTGFIGKEEYKATMALYDVSSVGGEVRRFLEVEIEADSECSSEVGLKALDKWSKRVQNHLNVGKPLNQSLYEIYTTKGKNT